MTEKNPKENDDVDYATLNHHHSLNSNKSSQGETIK
jgi:hypothetical protein